MATSRASSRGRSRSGGSPIATLPDRWLSLRDRSAYVEAARKKPVRACVREDLDARDCVGDELRTTVRPPASRGGSSKPVWRRSAPPRQAPPESSLLSELRRPVEHRTPAPFPHDAALPRKRRLLLLEHAIHSGWLARIPHAIDVEYPGHAGPSHSRCLKPRTLGKMLRLAISKRQMTYGTRNAIPSIPPSSRPFEPFDPNGRSDAGDAARWTAPTPARPTVSSHSSDRCGCTRVPDSGFPGVGPRRERRAPASGYPWPMARTPLVRARRG